MPGLLSALRAVGLFAAVVTAACVPALATDWLLREPRYGQTFGNPAPELSEEDLLPLPVASPTWREDRRFAPEELDIRGNEIVRPVERYGVDRRGSLYELHSPDTEIPRLAPPEL